MKLTRKCKYDFENWFLQNDDLNEDYYVECGNKFSEYRCIHYSELPQSMQYGIYVDFFDSVKFYIGRDEIENYWLQVDNENFFDTEEWHYLIFDDLPSRAKAIEKANEIYNER